MDPRRLQESIDRIKDLCDIRINPRTGIAGVVERSGITSSQQRVMDEFMAEMATNPEMRQAALALLSPVAEPPVATPQPKADQQSLAAAGEAKGENDWIPRDPPARKAVKPEPPSQEYMFPASDPNNSFRDSCRVTAEMRAKVDAIRDEALGMGWEEERLYQNRGRFRFPLGDDYGLICFMGEGSKILNVFPDRIETSTLSGAKHSFRRQYSGPKPAAAPRLRQPGL